MLCATSLAWAAQSLNIVATTKLIAGVLSMLLGVAGSVVVAIVAIRSDKRLDQIEAGAAMDVIFAAMFTGGVLLLEQSDAGSVYLDVEHALYGSLESLIWLDATGWSSRLDPVALSRLPAELPRMAITLVVVALFIFWRHQLSDEIDYKHLAGICYVQAVGGFALREANIAPGGFTQSCRNTQFCNRFDAMPA